MFNTEWNDLWRDDSLVAKVRIIVAIETEKSFSFRNKIDRK